jgi:hypothetical protein
MIHARVELSGMARYSRNHFNPVEDVLIERRQAAGNGSRG